MKENPAALQTILIRGENAASVFAKECYSCRGFLIREPEICLVHQVNTGFYQIPGGRLEAGESPEACCVREVEEETGYRVRIEQSLFRIQELYGDWNYQSQYFLCEIEGLGEINLTEEERDQNLRVEWMDFGAALEFFSTYKDYKSRDPVKYGSFYREYLALHALRDILK